MLLGIGDWLFKAFANWLLGIATKELKKRYAQMRKDIERGKVNEKNAKRYQDAQVRLERVRAAQDLLNGTNSPS